MLEQSKRSRAVLPFAPAPRETLQDHVYRGVKELILTGDIAPGQSVTITLSGTVDPSATGTLTNTATVAPPAGVTDPDPGNNSGGDTDTLTPVADLVVTKDDGVLAADDVGRAVQQAGGRESPREGPVFINVGRGDRVPDAHLGDN